MKKTTVLKLNKDFKRLYYRGKSMVDPALVTYALRSPVKGENRMGITVTKKLGKAVCRNRCKRIIRASYQLLEPQLPEGWDFIFVARGKTISMKSTELMPVMKKHIETLTKAASQDATNSKQNKNKKTARPQASKSDKDM